ncbi:tank-1 [Symbiodinium necroappetens]|uniref:Poly [ADP-ribose] polymerase n=1 Tax=Symbiodinium necroappetens TaxID=1628268 RepID=A0A812QQF1_9DINO|nr:tank-1 [Symbiodinium necroappetens]
MGSGASKAPDKKSPRVKEPVDEADAKRVEGAKRGHRSDEDWFFDKLNSLAAEGDANDVKVLIDKWPKCVGKPGAREATVTAALAGNAETLETLLSLGVRPYIGRDDPEVNPLMAAIKTRHWNCIVLLVERALKYDFSTGLLQDGMQEFVLSGDTDMVDTLVTKYKIPGNSKLLTTALLKVKDPEKAAAMFERLAEGTKSFNTVSTVAEEEGSLGGEFAPIHAACVAKKDSLHRFIPLLLDKGADLSLWGKMLSLKTSYAKRLPLHYAAENKSMKTETVLMVAKAYPQALFEPVNNVPGRALPCQCSKHNPETQQALEKFMYEYICEACDGMKPENMADLFRLMRLAIEFEGVRTIPTEELPRGKVTALVSPLVREGLHGSEAGHFVAEATAFASANPRVNLGREGETKVQVKSISSIGKVLQSDFWELLRLVSRAGKGKADCSELLSPTELENLLSQEISARLQWAAEACASGKESLADGLSTSDAVRYALFVVAGLSSAAKSPSGDGDDEPSSGPATMASLAMSMVGENLEALVSWYCQELQIPSGWNLLDLLKQGLAGGGEGLCDIVFSAGDIVIKKALPADHPQFQWLQGLFEKTFLGIYTRDRKGESVPKSLEVQEVEQVYNCGSWGEYARRRQAVMQDMAKGGTSWVGELKTDKSTLGEPPDWQTGAEPGPNEHWLFHGTSLAGEAGITEGDFRLNMAGSNAGTLYGNGVYLAEAVSKSDEYTTPHPNGLRSMLICLSALGQVNYNDQKRPDGDELAASCKGGGFHSILGDREKIRGTYREIVVFDEDQVYPAYVCRYKRVT